MDFADQLQIIQRLYSPLKNLNYKWISAQNQSSFGPSQALPQNLSQNLNQKYSTIKNLTPKQLANRIKLKRSPLLFHAIKYLWKKLNPFQLKSLSKNTLQTFNTFIYFHLTNLDQDRATIQSYLQTDMKQDFKSNEDLIFSEFYDSFFQLLDNLTSTKLLSEYVRVTKKISEAIVSNKIFKYKNLSAKSHIRSSPSRKLHYWMKELLYPCQNFQLSKISSLKAIPPVMLERPKIFSKKTMSDITMKKIDQLKKQSQTKLRLHSQHRMQVVKHVRKPYKEYRQKITPLTQRKRPFKREKDVIQQIIKNRKLYFEAINNQVFK